MTDKDLYGGLIRLHILHHAAEEPVFGLGIIEELRRHGYEMSAGTVYPMRHCCKVSDEAAFCLIQRPYISKTLLT
ncbi:PadR family transcriptional regulator, partial [Escherichia coli]|nr:PadR family transcriptional regulator [Escherichia coli]